MGMTEEEAVQLASKGNVDAMMALGMQYKDIPEKAARWFEMAAHKGNITAIDWMCAYLRILASLEELASSPSNDEVIDKREKILNLLKLKIDVFNSKVKGYESINLNKLMSDLSEAECDLETSYFYKGMLDEVNMMIQNKGVDNIIKREFIMYACINAYISEDRNKNKLRFELLNKVENDLEYASAEKGVFEEAIYAITITKIAFFYREVYGNIDKAYQLLMTMLNYMQSDTGRKTIANELSHYHKKMFGGYKYVE